MFDASAPPTDDACPFCDIARAHRPYDPLQPPSALSAELTSPSSFVVLSTPALIAFLDIMPLSPGHLLLCPRPHRPKLTDASAQEARELGAYVRVLSAALARATGVEDWNVVQNNGAAAAQVVPHMHYHLIPRPEIRASGRFSESFTMFGRGRREELDDDEADKLAEELRRQVAVVLREEQQQEQRQLAKAKAKM
ncbi:Nitrilase and fragile histidine triad fusion protein NitFhit [Tolypocladium capitatum]|uniref:Nitrilase and fragile histidine triad fusion protein NitFhit n=1 Tax=Tolypocladium capitatum TaxID=45235 RepID=A0A2K3Q9T2_9HYPO|nr:Nitrilase and fragile histidine triad fusion protein NitFhit [Tolypocladium capitatum]